MEDGPKNEEKVREAMTNKEAKKETKKKEKANKKYGMEYQRVYQKQGKYIPQSKKKKEWQQKANENR